MIINQRGGDPVCCLPPFCTNVWCCPRNGLVVTCCPMDACRSGVIFRFVCQRFGNQVGREFSLWQRHAELARFEDCKAEWGAKGVGEAKHMRFLLRASQSHSQIAAGLSCLARLLSPLSIHEDETAETQPQPAEAGQTGRKATPAVAIIRRAHECGTIRRPCEVSHLVKVEPAKQGDGCCLLRAGWIGIV